MITRFTPPKTFSLLSIALQLAVLSCAEDLSGRAAIQARGSHMLLDLIIAAPPPFPVDLWPREKSSIGVNQVWNLRWLQHDNLYEIQHENTHKSLAWMSDGDAQVYAAQQDSNNTWTLVLQPDSTTFRLEGTGTGRCIGRNDESKGARVTLSDCSEASNQLWELVRDFGPGP
ncbi:hypothetical protein DFQ27_005362 [Actinomortierella ambigua]|uniref:Ricin B lectin domain-containing protein n=1 Tax=Actinomortierella ambigua TaxID=1343610 RepID=A0A9P6U2P1_9FUNG|nr:hypothetical protein DFQ27_005362 [Actinomortierella ambigua]